MNFFFAQPPPEFRTTRSGPVDLSFYKELGVDAKASPQEIGKAFRKASLLSHPDKNPNDPDAAARYRRLNHIYSVLSDKEKRMCYDAMGPDFETRPELELFKQQLRPPTLLVKVPVTLAQSLKGDSISVNYHRVNQGQQEKMTKQIELVAGSSLPAQFPFTGEGNVLPNQLPGDLVIALIQDEKDEFERVGDAISHVHTISLAEAIQGRVVIDHPAGGSFALTQNAGIDLQRWYRVEKQGVTDAFPMFVRFRLKMPTFTPAQRSMMLKALGAVTPTLDMPKTVSSPMSEEAYRRQIQSIAAVSGGGAQDQQHQVPECRQQ